MATLFFDIDGTLAKHQQILSPNLETLAQLRRQGHLVCICSGRPIHYIEVMFETSCDAIIASNGRYITYQGQVLYKEPLSSRAMWTYHTIAQKAGGMCHFAGLEKRFAYAIKDCYKDRLRQHVQQEITLIQQREEVETYSFEVNFLPPISFSQMQKAYGSEAVLNNHFDEFSADASTTSFDKGNGIEKLLELLRLDKKDTYAFGDGSNDVCMFRVCKHTIAMGNAVEELKQCAQFITSDYEKHGIQVALRHYGLL